MNIQNDSPPLNIPDRVEPHPAPNRHRGRPLETLVQLPAEALISRAETAALLGTTVSTLAKWAQLGKGPEYITLGHNQWVRYRIGAVRSFVDSNAISTDGGNAA